MRYIRFTPRNGAGGGLLFLDQMFHRCLALTIPFVLSLVRKSVRSYVSPRLLLTKLDLLGFQAPS
jgi:hypothetical protein